MQLNDNMNQCSKNYCHEMSIKTTFMQTANDKLWIFQVYRKNKY